MKLIAPLIVVVALATAAPALGSGYSTRQLSDARVGTSHAELNAQMNYSEHVIAYFSDPASANRWKSFLRHDTCSATRHWKLGPRARRVCDTARSALAAHRWLYALAKQRHDRLYAPKPVTVTVSANVGGVWGKIASCESGGNWSYSPFNHGDRPYSGFDGGVQFHPTTWSSYAAGTGYVHAYDAPASVQIAVAEKVLVDQGWGAWPACSASLGLR